MPGDDSTPTCHSLRQQRHRMPWRHLHAAECSSRTGQSRHQPCRCDFADSLVAGIAYIDIAGAIHRHALRVEESRRAPDAIIGAGQPGSGKCLCPDGTPAVNVAAATNSVARCARIADSVCREACLSSTSSFQLRNSVAQPMTSTANGRAINRIHRPTCGRSEYHDTIRSAVCAGSYCCGCRLRTKSAVMNSTAGKMSRISVAAIARLIVFIIAFILQSTRPSQVNRGVRALFLQVLKI